MQEKLHLCLRFDSRRGEGLEAHGEQDVSLSSSPCVVEKENSEIHGECQRNYMCSGFESRQGSPCSSTGRAMITFLKNLVAMDVEADVGKKTTLVLREWSCGFEARSAATSLRGGSAGSFPPILAVERSGECRTELQPPTLGWSGRFDSSWAYALWHERDHSGFVHPRRRCE